MLFGYAKNEIVGQLVEVLLPERYRGKHVGQRTSFFQSPSVRSMGKGMELFARQKDGSEFPVEISLSPVPTSGGMFVSSVIRDVTDRKLMEADIIAARKAAEASLSLTASRPQHRTRALSLILLGELAENRRQSSAAEGYWKTASAIAKALNDKELRFRAEFSRYKRAVKSQERPSARAIRRRLVKLASWLPPETDALEEFKAFSPENTQD